MRKSKGIGLFALGTLFGLEGIKILSFRYLPDKAKNAMSATEASLYKIRLSDKLQLTEQTPK